MVTKLDLVESFLAHLRVEKKVSQNTFNAYRNDLGQFQGFIKRRFAELGKEEESWHLVDLGLLNEYIEDLRNRKGYRATTTARKVASIKSFFVFLLAEGVISEDPAESLGSPRVSRSLPKWLSEKEVKQLLGKVAEAGTPESQRDTTVLELLYATGLRVSELLSLNVQDVDFQKSCIRYSGKGSEERLAFLEPETLDNLKKYLSGARTSILGSHKRQIALFVHNRGERLSRQWVWIILNTHGKKAGVDGRITPETLRHSFAIRLLQNGTSLTDLQRLLDHSSISTTQIYTRVVQEKLTKGEVIGT